MFIDYRFLYRFDIDFSFILLRSFGLKNKSLYEEYNHNDVWLYNCTITNRCKYDEVKFKVLL